MSNQVIATDFQEQGVQSPLVVLYELSLPNGTTVYFHPGVEEDLSSLHFRDFIHHDQINEYIAYPILFEGFEQSTTGAAARPTLTVANIGETL